MTSEHPADDVARWCVGLVAALSDAAARVGELAGRIADDWPDEHGREWADRAAALHRDLDDNAHAAEQLGAGWGTGVDPGPAPPRVGMRLGGTRAARTDDDHGMRIAELPDAPQPPG